MKLLLNLSSLPYGVLRHICFFKRVWYLYFILSPFFLQGRATADTLLNLSTPSDEFLIAEGCEAALFELALSAASSEPLDIIFTISGTAQNGEDINLIPPSIRLPAGDTLLLLPILAIADGIPEGPEYLNIGVQVGSLRDSFTLTIVDPIPEKPDLGPDPELCPGEEFVFSVSEGSFVRYDWFSGENLLCRDCPELSVPMDGHTIYIVETTDKLGCRGRDTAKLVFLPEVPPPQNLHCGTVTDQTLSIHWEAVPEARAYEVSIDGISWQRTELPFFEWQGLDPGEEQLFGLRTLGPCAASETISISCETLNCPVPGFRVESSDPGCPGSADGSLKILVDTPDQVKGYWFEGAFYTTNFFSGLSGGNYSIVVEMKNGCNFVLGVFLAEPPTIEIDAQVTSPATCRGSEDGAAELSWTDSDLLPDSIIWDNGEYGFRARKLSTGTHVATLYFPGFCPILANVWVPYTDSLSVIHEIHPVSCFGEADGELTVLAYGGTAPYGYVWNGGERTGSNINKLPPGIYALEARDARGCLLQDTFFFDEPEPLEVAIDKSDVTCAGNKNGTASSVVTGGRMPYSYFWSGGGRSDEVANLGQGTYRLFVQDSSGCRKNTDFEIFSPDSLKAEVLLQQPDCYGAANGAIEIFAEGGLGEYRIEWQDDSLAGFSRDQMKGGLYGFQIYDRNNCSLSRVLELKEPDSLRVAWSLTGESCPGNRDGSIALKVSGGTGSYSAIWQNGAVSMELHNLSASRQRVLIYDENGCLKEAAIEVPVEDSLRVSFVMDEPSCKGFSDGSLSVEIRGGTEPYTINWRDGESLPDRYELAAGLYALTITDSGSCKAYRQLSLTEPEALDVDYLFVPPTCDYSSDGSITLLPRGGVTPYTYGFGSGETETNRALAGLSEGIYPILLKDGNGCLLADTVFLESPEALSLKKKFREPLCFDTFDGQISLQAAGGNGGYEFSWLSPDGSQLEGAVIEGVGRGLYGIELRDQLSCVLRDTLFLDSPPLLQVELKMEKTVKEFISFTPLVAAKGGTGLYTYLWYWGDSLFYDCTNCLPPKVLPFREQNLKLELYDENGCLAVASQKLEIVKNREFFIPNVFSPNGDGINDTFELFGFGAIRVEVLEIFDRWGNLVFSSPPFLLGEKSRQWDGSLNGRNLPDGVYLWKLRAVFPDGFIDHKMGSILLVR